ncbi:MAG: GGDEF domain-containing protein [Burkholderiales bacterium]|nr:GGDEF domain-containing protein [Phycisphaerae bacterium]
MLVVLILIAVFIAWVIRISPATVTVGVPLLVIGGAAIALLLAGAAAYHILNYRIPLRQLARLLDEIEAGLAPIEELDQLPNSLAPLRRPVAEIVIGWKTAQSRMNELNEELRHRVANRTEALERQLGVLKAKASRDALTGLANRRTFDDELGSIVEACRKSKLDLVLLMIDVDYFKTLNDTLGHQAGDELLRALGQLIRSTIRPNDSAYRYGGDEFVVLLPDCDLTGAGALIKRLMRLVDGLTRHHRNLNPRPQLSIGACALSEVPADTNPTQLLAWADQKLYAIKHARDKSGRGAA